ncbi:beta-scruin [Nephila pilipes]|uniref:Beta-scruin n=1 Tax=Nephila pilipes TaxID=299642 RepID=A0A8X6MX59_NEPPI|nr:beta-scruin [Nephila pilipes]
MQRHYRGDDRNRSKAWRGDERYNRVPPSRSRDSKDADEEFETYNYEYKSESFIRSPKAVGDIRPKYRSPTRERGSRRYSPERSERATYQRRDRDRYSSKHINPSDRYRDRALLNLAATKIQAAFRGYCTRKEFWRQRERFRGLQSRAHAAHYGQDEYSLPSMTSIVDNSSISPLAANADPNLGLTSALVPIDSSQRNHILRDLKSKLTFTDEMPTANQLQSENSPTVIVLGGINPVKAGDYFLGGCMFVYNIQKDRWLFGGTMPEPRNYHGSAYLNGKIYVVGGYSPLHVHHGQMIATQSTFQLTIRSKRWRRRADMHQARACHGTCVIEENVMVFGGRDSSGKLLSTAEAYYPKRDQWTLVKPMPEPIMGMACAVLDGSVWVIGGIVHEGNSARYTVSNRVYIFDVQQQNWYHKLSLPEPRAYCSAVSLKREIWVWCGVKDTLSDDGYLTSTCTVFVYNPEVSKWEQHAAIGTAKHSAAIAKFGRRVFLLGGMSNASGAKEVLMENDYYNRESDRYAEGAPLPRPVTGATATALPIDYVATSDPKWVHAGHIDELHKRSYYAPLSESYNDKWKLFQRVQIDDWPPIPDPKNLPSELDVRFGTLPKGYTVTATATSGRTKVRRYVPLPEHIDPNLGIKLLGLRKVEHLPTFARDMLTVTNLQDDSLPVVLVMGGLQPKEPVNLSYGKLIMRYSPLKDRWEYYGVLPEPRNYHAAVYYREFIYVTGGCDPDKRNCGEMVATNTTYCLNIHSSEWIQRSEMLCTRSHHCLIAFQGRLYAIGGRDHNGRLVASIESYDIENDKWTLKRAMSQPRMGMACVIYQDNIWCIGGIGLSDDSEIISYPVLSSVISYDVAKDA